MNTKEQNSVRARVMRQKDGQDWSGGTTSVRVVDYGHVNTTNGDLKVRVDGDNAWLTRDDGVVYRMTTKDYARLMQKNIKKLVDL